ncbi:Conserved hypothetical protein CHP02453 [Fusarium oxysporum f. sp. vasinfectum]|uniref:DUF2461 domain-containing protein n=1 Tax=Fusarium oxysporum f. sp. vasinfectum 25433 TaxID=1089449 RepID=X0KXD7_FUSOX|nr:hypothetical protein FOTG_18216 [Fusarium oxysporum f. sp. vasinfectum 25433]KAK2923629.1 Conserved hypothetical protein CHP02453 [Fusarium oxysporum f. sp. vasinfectum]KAK2938696.1 Conserved hypothetical protein CHP02453 [Fusarium oxysporum f. sp. vasinfectum]
MAMKKRKHSNPPEPQLRRSRLRNKLRKTVYVENTDSDDDSAHGSVSTAGDASRARQSRYRPEDSEDSYLNDSEEDYDSDDNSEHLENTAEPDETHTHELCNNPDEDASPSVTIIPLEKMRDDGGIAYVDYKLHPNSLFFLEDLKSNNNRAWLKAHDGEFRRAYKDWQTFVEHTTSSIMSIDDTIPELPAKDVMFRIYRDLRFIPDGKPYKAHFSAAWSRMGRKGTYAHYYIHCEPGMSFAAGGIFGANAEQLQRLRTSIDERPRRWRRVLNDDSLKLSFLPQARGEATEEAALKAFALENKETALKARPKGFSMDHRDIELLKLRKFTVSRKIPDSILYAEDIQERIVEILQPLVAFISFLNSVVMPDHDASSSSEDDS